MQGWPPPMPEDGLFLSWQLMEWGIGIAASAFTASFWMIWRIGRKVGGFEEAFAMLESRVEANKIEGDERSDKIDKRLNSVDESNRKIENAVFGLPGSIIEIKESLRDVTRRIDEMMRRQP